MAAKPEAAASAPGASESASDRTPEAPKSWKKIAATNGVHGNH